MTNTRAVDVLDAAFDEAFRRGHKADTDTIVKILRKHGFKIMSREPTPEMLALITGPEYYYLTGVFRAMWDAAP